MILDYVYEMDTSELEVSYINKNGKRALRNFKYEPYVWRKHKGKRKTKYQTWDGKPVYKKKGGRPDKHVTRFFIKDLKKNHPELFEATMPKIVFCDIEAVAANEFPEPSLAKYPVNTICLVNEDQEVFMLSTKNLPKEQIKKMEIDINDHFKSLNLDQPFTLSFKAFNSEKEMLSFFFLKAMPRIEVLSGWHVDDFDWNYLYNRGNKLGINVNASSPVGKMHYKPKSKSYAKPQHTLILDYLKLYEKFDYSVKIKESSKLDWVSEEVLGLKKIKFDGSLHQLWERDPYRFILYNAIDTCLVKLVHDVIQCSVPYFLLGLLTDCRLDEVFSPVALTENAIVEDAFNDYNIVFTSDKEHSDESGDYAGGYVKEISPIVKNKIGILDFSSLYPSLMRMFNISPDSYVGQVAEDDKYLDIRSGELKDINENDHIKTVNDSVFSTTPSLFKNKLTSFYKLRKSYQKQMFIADENADLIKNVLKTKF